MWLGEWLCGQHGGSERNPSCRGDRDQGHQQLHSAVCLDQGCAGNLPQAGQAVQALQHCDQQVDVMKGEVGGVSGVVAHGPLHNCFEFERFERLSYQLRGAMGMGVLVRGRDNLLAPHPVHAGQVLLLAVLLSRHFDRAWMCSFLIRIC